MAAGEPFKLFILLHFLIMPQLILVGLLHLLDYLEFFFPVYQLNTFLCKQKILALKSVTLEFSECLLEVAFS